MPKNTPPRESFLRRMRLTPLEDWLRGRPMGWLDVIHLVEQTNLPDNVQSLILYVVRRTRLWRREKLDVVVELIAHFQDGLEAGRSADELVATFGDVKQTAKLIRRGKKRNRPMWWQVLRRCPHAFGAFVGLYVLAGVALMLDRPNPTVDYLAKINAAALAVPVEDQAWPIYRKAFIECQFYNFDTSMPYVKANKHNRRLARNDYTGPRPGFDGRWVPSVVDMSSIRLGDAEWPDVVTFLETQRDLLDAIRLGGTKAGLGLTVGYEGHWTGDDRLALFGPDNKQKRYVPVGHADALAYYSL